MESDRKPKPGCLAPGWGEATGEDVFVAEAQGQGKDSLLSGRPKTKRLL